MFGNFKFRSFKSHKLLEEDYDLLPTKIDDPEDPDLQPIQPSKLFPEEKVVKEAVEIVPITKEELTEENKYQNKLKAE